MFTLTRFCGLLLLLTALSPATAHHTLAPDNKDHEKSINTKQQQLRVTATAYNSLRHKLIVRRISLPGEIVSVPA